MDRKNKSVWTKTSIPMAVAVLTALSLALFIVPVSAAATTIAIGDVFVEPGENAVMLIMINNVTNLGVADINLSFDPSVVHVVSATNSDFDFIHAVINNSTGIVRIGGIDYYSNAGLNGNVKLAEITLKAVGNADETSSLGIIINELKEAGPPPEISISTIADNGTAVLNLPPVAIARSMHCYNNMGSSYSSKTIFNGSTSYDLSSNGNITNYDWDFGDEQSGAGKIVEHVYSSYKWNEENHDYEPLNVSLTVKDNGGLTNTVRIKTNVFIAGDANGDGKVNIADAVWVGNHWRATCNTSVEGGYVWDEPQADGADMNNDCKINVLDVVIIGENWRHTAW